MKKHKILRQTIKGNGAIHTISWLNDGIMDWAQGGTFYGLNGETSQIGQYYFAFKFDRSITSQDGNYAFKTASNPSHPDFYDQLEILSM